LVLGLEAARKLKIEQLKVYGDTEIIVKQVKQQYQAQHPRLISYRNYAWDLMENFFSSFNIHSIPRMENQQSVSLSKVVATFIPPIVLKLKHHIEMRHRPSIPNNFQH
jgi:ribonuclease HI